MNDPAPPDRRELPLELLDQIDRICDRFEAAWESDTRPRIEDHLDEVPAAYRLALLSDLLAAELRRRRRGEQPEPREYADRFPEGPETIAAAPRGAAGPAGRRDVHGTGRGHRPGRRRPRRHRVLPRRPVRRATVPSFGPKCPFHLSASNTRETSGP